MNMTLSDVTNAVSAPAKQSTAAGSPQDVEDRFLKLLITQVQSQDPLNPLDNAQVTSQLAQLSTVTGVNKLNDSINQMVSQFSGSQSLQAAGLIGRQVLASGNQLQLTAGAAKAGFDLAGAADNVTVTIKDAAGMAVDQVDLGAHPAGVATFAWDGKNSAGAVMPDGAYKFEITAAKGTDKVAASALSFGTVNSVLLGGKGMEIDIAGLGSKTLPDIKQIM